MTSVLMVAVMATVMAEVVMVGDGRDVEGGVDGVVRLRGVGGRGLCV